MRKILHSSSHADNTTTDITRDVCVPDRGKLMGIFDGESSNADNVNCVSDSLLFRSRFRCCKRMVRFVGLPDVKRKKKYRSAAVSRPPSSIVFRRDRKYQTRSVQANNGCRRPASSSSLALKNALCIGFALGELQQ